MNIQIKNSFLLAILCLFSLPTFGQVRLDFSFGGAINSKPKISNTNYENLLGINANIGIGYENKLSEKLYVCPSLMYRFTNSMTKTDLVYTNAQGASLDKLKYTIQTNSIILGCHIGFVYNKTYFELMPNFQYVFSNVKYNIEIPNSQNEVNNYLFGTKINIGYYFGKNTKCALYFDTNLMNLYGKNTGLPSYIRCFGVNITQFISKPTYN